MADGILTPCNVIRGDMSFCTSLRNFIQIASPSAEKNDVMSIFKMEDQTHLGFYGPIMGSFKSPCATSYRSSIETIALALDCSAITARRVCIAQTMPSQDVCACLCVCLSHASIESKRLHVSSQFFHHRVAPPNSSYPTPNGMTIFRRRPPNGGVECKGGIKNHNF